MGTALRGVGQGRAYVAAGEGALSRAVAGTGVLRVCFLAGELGRGGAERQLVHMLRTLADSPIETRVLCLTRGEAFEHAIREVGVPLEHVGDHPYPAFRLATIINSLRRTPADVLHAVHFYMGMYAGLAGLATGATSIGASRSSLDGEVRSNWPFGKAHLLLPDFWLANSGSSCDQAVLSGRDPSTVFLLPNAVEMPASADAAMRERARRANTGARELRLLLVGRLVPVKRVDRFLCALRALNDRMPGWLLEARIVGDGGLRTELERTRDSLGLSPSSVRFLGEVPDPSDSYRWADMLVLASDTEGTPNAVLEAMSWGLPVVATAVGGVPDLLQRGGGRLVLPEVEALADAIAALARNPEERLWLGGQGLSVVAGQHSLGCLRRRLSTLYRTMLSEGRVTRLPARFSHAFRQAAGRAAPGRREAQGS